MRDVVRHWVPAWPWKRVFALWLGLTVVIGVTVLAWLLPLPDGPLRLPMVAAHFLGPLTIFVVGLVLLARARLHWSVVVGMVALLWASMHLGLGCPGVACREPPGYAHWRNIQVAIDIGISGPRLLFTSEPGSCAFNCPYMIQLIPLAIGYFAYADALTSRN